MDLRKPSYYINHREIPGMGAYKKEIDLLRQEISLMDNHLSTLNDENVKLVNPQIIQNFDDLQA